MWGIDEEEAISSHFSKKKKNKKENATGLTDSDCAVRTIEPFFVQRLSIGNFFKKSLNVFLCQKSQAAAKALILAEYISTGHLKCYLRGKRVKMHINDLNRPDSMNCMILCIIPILLDVHKETSASWYRCKVGHIYYSNAGTSMNPPIVPLYGHILILKYLIKIKSCITIHGP